MSASLILLYLVKFYFLIIKTHISESNRDSFSTSASLERIGKSKIAYNGFEEVGVCSCMYVCIYVCVLKRLCTFFVYFVDKQYFKSVSFLQVFLTFETYFLYLFRLHTIYSGVTLTTRPPILFLLIFNQCLFSFSSLSFLSFTSPTPISSSLL